MIYSEVATTFEAMDATSKRLELTQLLADLLKKTPGDLIDKMVYLIQGKLYPDFMGIEIGLADKLVMRSISSVSGRSQKDVEKSYHHFGDIGTAAEDMLQIKDQTTLFSEQLTVERVYKILDNIARTTGKGSLEIRLRHLNSLLSDASPKEANYILRTVTGRLRLGIADYTVLDALSIAFTGDKSNRPTIERAYNLSSDLGLVAKSIFHEGLKGIENFRIKAGNPVRPMLAERLESSSAILEKMGGKCALEYKLDGERIQISFDSNKFVLFSRKLENITNQYPDVANLARSNLKSKEYIIEGEVVAIDFSTGHYLPFQELMHRRRKYGVKQAIQKYPVSIVLFDILFNEGKDLTGLPYQKRHALLENIVEEGPQIKVVPSIITTKTEEVDKFMAKALDDGCEGLVIKDLKSVYRAGAREFSWIKLKQEYSGLLTDSLDLVVVGAFYGHGRRKGKFGAFLLGTYNKNTDSFETVSKVGTGFSDENLNKFLKVLNPLIIPHIDSKIISNINADVWFTPKIVIEVIASEITLSPIHTVAMNSVRKNSGLALRFPKFTGRIRDDKTFQDSTSSSEILQMYNNQRK